MRTFQLLARATVLTLAASTAGLPPARADARDDEIRALHALAADIERRLQALEAGTPAAETVPAPSPPAKVVPPPATVAADASGISIRSGDDRYQMRLRGNLQADARFFIGDEVPGNDTFVIRRARLILEGSTPGGFSFRAMPDFAGSSATLYDAYAAWRHGPALNIKVGKDKVPFDLERLVSQTSLLFMERGYPTALAPNRDIGVQVFGDVLDGRLSYQLAWLNGANDGESSVSDAGDGKDLVARLFARPFRDREDSFWRGLGFGIAASQGEKSGAAPSGYRTLAQQTFFRWRGTVVSDGVHTRIEPQLYHYAGPFGLMASWASSKQEVSNGATRATLENTGWSAAVNWVVTGEGAGFSGVTPARDFDPAAGSWGAWEVAARVGQLAIDEAAFPLFADPATSARCVTSFSLGSNWHLNRNVKLSLNYEHSDFDGGESGTVTATDENAVLSRVQLRF